MEAAIVAGWTFVQEVPVPTDIQTVLVEGEEPVTAFKTMRDSAVFTTKRLIVRDAQGFTGKKVEMYSLPYSSINMWSTENAGPLDLNPRSSCGRVRATSRSRSAGTPTSGGSIS